MITATIMPMINPHFTGGFTSGVAVAVGVTVTTGVGVGVGVGVTGGFNAKHAAHSRSGRMGYSVPTGISCISA